MALETVKRVAGGETASEEVRLKQYELILEMYRHHFDLYLKVVALYLGSTGAAAGFIFAASTTADQRTALLGFLGLVSGASALANGFVFHWLRSTQRVLDDIQILGWVGLGRGRFGSAWATLSTNTWGKSGLGREYAGFRIYYYVNVRGNPNVAWLR